MRGLSAGLLLLLCPPGFGQTLRTVVGPVVPLSVCAPLAPATGPAPASALAPSLTLSLPSTLESMRELVKAETPVRIRWTDKETGQTRETLAKVSSVYDTQTIQQGRMVKRWIVSPDNLAASIDLESIQSVTPAGMTPEEYDRTIHPEPAKSLEEELVRVGLTPEQAAAMQFMTVHELLSQDRQGALSLGVTDNLDQYTALVRSAHLTHWKVAYYRMFRDFETPRTPEFMEAFTRGDGPIYFFLPPGVMRTDDEGIGYFPNTRDELNWLLAHPDRMKNVRFVLGAYTLFSKENENRLFSLGLRKGKGLRRKLLRDAFEEHVR